MRYGRLGPALALLGALAMMPTPALAGRGYYRNASPWAATAYGPVYNPALSREFRQAGGNPYAYQQLMRQKLMVQQQMMLKQQQAYQKWFKEQQARQAKGQPTDPAFDQEQRLESRQQAAYEAARAREEALRAGREAARERHEAAVKAPKSPASFFTPSSPAAPAR